MKIPKPHYDSDAEHSEYSPSGAKRWINCPASIQFLRGLKKLPEKTNAYAEEGTAAHELAAYCLDNDVMPDKCIGRIFNKHRVDAEMARQVTKYVNYVNGVTTWDATLWVESRLSLETLRPDTFGTADAIVVSNDYIEVIDLKYGKGVVVEVEDNYQLFIYGIGVLAHLAKHGLKFEPHFEVKMTIVQPRASHEDGPIRSVVKTVSELKDFKQIAKTAIDISGYPEAPFGPSAEVCRWCEGAPTCRAFADHNLELAKLEFADLALSPLAFRQKLPSIAELSEYDLANILRHSKSLEVWLKAVLERTMELMRQDHKIPGYKLVYGRSIRAWSDQAAAFKVLEAYGTDTERLYTRKFLSPTQAEKELTDAEWELVKPLVFKPTGKLSVAPEHDGRPAVDPHKVAIEEWREEDI